MSLVKKLTAIAISTAVLTPIGVTGAEAKAGAKCPKIGQIRVFGGERHRCTATKKAGKTSNTWVKIASGPAPTTTTTTTTTTPPPVVTTATVDCGPSFDNSRYPRFRLDEMLLKPATQSVFTYLSTERCLVTATWTPSNDPQVNASREIFLCITYHDYFPTNLSMRTNCDFDNPRKMPDSGQFRFGMWKEYEPGMPFYGFVVVTVKGYLDGKRDQEWESPRHLIMYDVDRSLVPSTWTSYYRLNDIRIDG